MTVPTDAEDTASLMNHSENREEGQAPVPADVGRHCCENCGKLAPLSRIKDITGYYMVCAECSGDDE